ncbi:MAG: O-antigen ligase family protein [Candidatus Omnitrophica bacterium]|nr:O-antigen ligase family protein [Candidatus Omnitrophota bacterium]
MTIFWLDRLMFYALCALFFVLPAAIAGVGIFGVLAIVFFLLKTWLVFSEKSRHCGWGGVLKDISARSFGEDRGVLLPVFLYAAYCYSSIFTSLYPSLSIPAFFGKILEGVFILLAMRDAVSSYSRAKTLLIVVLSGAFILCLDGFIQLGFGHDIFKHLVAQAGRVSASFKHPNGLGAYLIVPVLLGLGWVMCGTWKAWQKSWKILVASPIFLVAMVSVMGLTYSRGAWLGMFVAIVLLGCLQRRWIVFIGSVTLVFFFVFSPLLLQVRDVSIGSDAPAQGLINIGNVGSGRYTFWKDAIKIIEDHPVFGTGLNTYTIVIKDYAAIWRQYPHNSYLQKGAELGLVGLALFLWMLGAVVAGAFRSLRAMPAGKIKMFYIALWAGFVGLLVQSGVDTTMYSVQHGVFIWGIMGFLMPSVASRILKA